jgi:hypothetical protein
MKLKYFYIVLVFFCCSSIGDRMLEYYRIEEKTEDKILSDYEIDTYVHISEEYREFAKNRVKMVKDFAKRHAQDFYEYFATKQMLYNLNDLTEWDKEEYKSYDTLLYIKGEEIKLMLKGRFRAWNDCIRILVSYMCEREFSEGRELKGGTTGVDYMKGEKVGWPSMDSTMIYEKISSPKIKDKFMVAESEHKICIGVPVIFDDHYVCDLVAHFYKI